MHFNDFVARERAFHTSKHALISLVSHLGVIALTTAFLWGNFVAWHLIAWAVTSAVIAGAGWFWNHSAEKQYARRHHPVAKHGRTLESAAVGIMWGLVPVLFFNGESTEYIVLIIAIYSGYVSGALGVSYSNAASFWGFSLGISVPFASRMFYEGGELYSLVGALIIFYVLALSYVANNMQTLFRESSRSKFENLTLLEEIAHEKETAEKAVISKDRFLASASHDLRQPLNAVTLFVDALLPMQSSQLGQDIIGKIKLSMGSLNGMLHSLLDISKLDADAIDLKPEPIALHAMIEQLLQEYRETKAGKLELTNHVPRNVVIEADRTVLYRVIRNILDNAVKYTLQGGVTVTGELQRNALRIQITDTGIGIPKDAINRVFEEFEQLNNAERNREKGLGLGLSIVKRLCDLSHIPLAIESDFGKGTSLMLDLPLSDKPIQAGIQRGAELHMSDYLVVVIDDEPDILESISQVLQAWGTHVVAAQSLEQAMSLLIDLPQPPDFIVSDFRLANNEQGTDVIEVIREEFNRDIPAVLITGDTAPDRVTAAQTAGLEVLYKPFDEQALMKMISKAIAKEPLI